MNAKANGRFAGNGARAVLDDRRIDEDLCGKRAFGIRAEALRVRK